MYIEKELVIIIIIERTQKKLTISSWEYHKEKSARNKRENRFNRIEFGLVISSFYDRPRPLPVVYVRAAFFAANHPSWFDF